MANLPSENETIPIEELVNPTGDLSSARLSADGPSLLLDHAFDRLEIDVGERDAAARFEVVSALDWPALHARYVVTQPGVIERDPRHGWAAIGGIYPDTLVVGARTTPQFDLTGLVPEAQLLFHERERSLSVTACGVEPVEARFADSDRLGPGQLKIRS